MATLLLDLDGVTADLHTPWLQAVRDQLGEPLHLEDITYYDRLAERRYYDLLDAPGFYGQVLPVPGSLQVIPDLIEAGYRVAFLTAAGKPSLVGKWEWVERYFSEVGPSNLVFAWQKDLLARPGSVLLDDAPHNVERFRYAGGEAVVFDRPWNRDVPGPRVRDWHEFQDWVRGNCRTVG